MTRYLTLLFVLLSVPAWAQVGPQASITCPIGAIPIPVGTSIQTAVNTAAAGATFCLAAGVHTVSSSVQPKTGNTFVGAYGAILDGTGWVSTDTTAAAFRAHNADIDNVTIKNLLIRNMPQKGIHCFKDHSDGWLVENNEITVTKYGLHTCDAMVVRDNNIHHNIGDDASPNPDLRGGGYLGYSPTDVLFDGNEIHHNGREQKQFFGSNIRFVDNYAHDGVNGLWCDACEDVLFEGNIATNFSQVGIFPEVSKTGIIRNNTLQNNGTGIYLSGAQGFETYNNTLSGNFRAIQYFIDCSRLTAPSPPPYGPIDLANNNTHDNAVTVGVQAGALGNTLFLLSTCSAAQITTYTTAKNLVYQGNDYIVTSATTKYWNWGNVNRTFAEWQALGNDTTGSSTVAPIAPPPAGPTCGTPTLTLSTPGAFPVTSASDVVRITAATTLSATRSALCVQVASGGSLTWASSGGVLSVGTLICDAGSTCSAPGVTGELSFKSIPINTTTDPDSIMTGLICQGTCNFQGLPVATTFVRLAAELTAGATTFTTASATGWVAGDRVWFPWTKQPIQSEQFAAHIERSEYATITSCAGTTCTVTAPLVYNHKGARTAAGVLLSYLPHVAKINRSFVIRSEAPSGGTRGHVIFQGAPTVTLKYVHVKDTGRTLTWLLSPTNLKGRYGVHLHMIGDRSPIVVGNSIENASKWGIAIHMTHRGTIMDNVVINAGGGGIVTEDGSESWNVIDHNFVCGTYGHGGRQQFAREGINFWFRGPNNYVRNNVACNNRSLDGPEASYGYEFYLEQLPNISYPTLAGGAILSNQNPHKLPILQFEDNESYAGYGGATFWWIGMKDITPQAAPTTTIKNLTLWHHAENSIFSYPMANVVYDNTQIFGDMSSYVSSVCCQIGWWPGDYAHDNVTLLNMRIEGLRYGIKIPRRMVGGTFTMTSPVLRNGTRNIENFGPWSVGVNAAILGKRNIFLTNPTFGGVPGQTGTLNIRWGCGPAVGANLVVLDRMTWDGDNVFSSCQAGAYVTATTTINAQGIHTMEGQPAPGGLTNTQLVAAGLAPYGGEVATCLTTDPDLSGGFRCDTGITPPVPPPLATASIDVPSNGQTDVTDTLTNGSVVRWLAVTNATSYDVFHGTGTPPAFLTNTTAVFATVPQRADGQRYYWQVNPKNATQVAIGPVWTYVMYDPPDPPIPPDPPVTPPTNDDFATAVLVAGDQSSDPVLGTTINATRQTGEPAGEHTVWYRWVPSVSGNGTVVLNTATQKTKVYTGTVLTDLVEVGASDTQNTAIFTTVAARAYYIRIEAVSETGPFSFHYGTEEPPQPPPLPETLTIVTGPLPSGTVGTAYPATTMTTTGGVAPVTWVATGLATGLTLSGVGVITGTPTAAGTFTAAFTATDIQPTTAEASRTITIASVIPPSETLEPPLIYQPINGATNVKNSTTNGPYIRWWRVTNATQYQVYHGTSASPPLLGTIAASDPVYQAPYPPGSYQYQVMRRAKTSYFWKICAINDDGQACSPVWRYKTR